MLPVHIDQNHRATYMRMLIFHFDPIFHLYLNSRLTHIKANLPRKEARSHKGSYKEEENTCKYCDKKPKIYKHIRKHEECTHEAIYCEECELKDENAYEGIVLYES